jgi:heat-inducible transcriptional repressor
MTNLTSVVLGPDATKQTLQHIKLFPISEQSAVAVFITNQGHTENKMFQFEEVIPLEDIQLCCDVLNSHLYGTPIGEIVEKMNFLQPVLSKHVKRSEALFQAFINAFIRFTSDNVYFSGKNNMLYQPEFSDIEKLRRLMSMMENSSIWRQIKTTEEGVNIQIGTHENVLELDDVSVVSSKFRMRNNEEGQLMVVGPTRMDYDKVVSMMEFMTTTIESLFIDDNEEGERQNE